jgi:hypothetical protein
MACKRSYSEISEDVTENINDIRFDIQQLEEMYEIQAYNQQIDHQLILNKINLIGYIFIIFIFIIWYIISKH